MEKWFGTLRKEKWWARGSFQFFSGFDQVTDYNKYLTCEQPWSLWDEIALIVLIWNRSFSFNSVSKILCSFKLSKVIIKEHLVHIEQDTAICPIFIDFILGVS